jgi:hypothetical protein
VEPPDVPVRLRWSIPLLAALLVACGPRDYRPRNGDIIFQTSRSAQSLAIQRATHSRYSHVGIVYLEGDRPFVYEAVQPVGSRSFDDWVGSGEGGHFVVKRLRDADRLLTPSNLDKMKAEGERFRGKDYDPTFEWSDDRLYCSELVWKIYQRALGVELGRPQRLGDLDLSDPMVKVKIQERWGDTPPTEEMVISPGAMYGSPLLVTVYTR